jgi:peptidoglycan/xylan/chitin deacetylase (PgdA/CDA1 family)
MRVVFVSICAMVALTSAFVARPIQAAALKPIDSATNASGITIYLTFDDGPYAGRTDSILDTLAKYNVKATFFMEGGHVARGNFSQVRRVVSEGHRLGNHLWLELADIMFRNKPAADTLQNQYNMAEDIFHQALGDSLWATYQSQPRLFRWPGGSPFVLPGMPNVYNYNWNVSSGDDVSGNITISRILNNVLYGYAPNHIYGVFAWGNGAILMFHDTSNITSLALPTVLKNLQAHGVSFGLLPRPGDAPGTVIGELGGVPPCAKVDNCSAANRLPQ